MHWRLPGIDAVLRHLRPTQGAGRRLGKCPACRSTVFATDPHTWYRGAWWHAYPCRGQPLRDRR